MKHKVTMALSLREVDLLSHGEYISADKALGLILLVKASLACDSACATPMKNVGQDPQPLVVTPSRAISCLQRRHNCPSAYSVPTGLWSTTPGLLKLAAACAHLHEYHHT
jgi:hypothetical protein